MRSFSLKAGTSGFKSDLKGVKTMEKKAQPIEEWRTEAVNRFGKDPKKWAFICPACGHVATPADFLALNKDPNNAATECIGRANGKGQTPDPSKPAPDGCNWCAYGLFGTMGKGRRVLTESGDTMEVFDFANT